MADTVSRKKRSEIMSKVGRKNTPAEVLVRKFLFINGFRYRNNYKLLPGSPDIVLPKYKTAIFVHGCFWHGHTCKAGGLPKSNLSFWAFKIDTNQKRDRRKKRELQKLGWKVYEIWECQLRPKKRLKTLSRVVSKLSAPIVSNASVVG